MYVECDSETVCNVTKAMFYIPFSELEFSLEDDIVMEFEVKPGLKDNEYHMKALTMFETTKPDGSVCMYNSL